MCIVQIPQKVIFHREPFTHVQIKENPTCSAEGIIYSVRLLDHNLRGEILSQQKHLFLTGCWFRYSKDPANLRPTFFKIRSRCLSFELTYSYSVLGLLLLPPPLPSGSATITLRLQPRTFWPSNTLMACCADFSEPNFANPQLFPFNT